MIVIVSTHRAQNALILTYSTFQRTLFYFVREGDRGPPVYLVLFFLIQMSVYQAIYLANFTVVVTNYLEEKKSK